MAYEWRTVADLPQSLCTYLYKLQYFDSASDPPSGAPASKVLLVLRYVLILEAVLVGGAARMAAVAVVIAVAVLVVQSRGGVS